MQFNLNTSRGRDAFHDVQFFAEEQEWSIGYSVPEGKATTDEKTGVRFIKQLELYEYSPVLFGAAPSTRTLSVKDDPLEIEGDEDIDWDELKAGDYSDLNFKIPDGVKKQAQMGLDMSREYNRGGTSVGKNTANYLVNNTIAAPRKVRHIAKYFPRHEVDLRTPANSRPGADGYPGAGLIAWKLWGGDAGRTWATKLVDAMNRRDEEKSFQVEESKAPAMSAMVEKALKNKVKEHNEKYGDSAGKRATYEMLAACYRRGIGAYRTNPSSVRPTVSSPEQWAMARVNGLLFALRTGGFRRGAYDTDLLPSAHPLSSRKKDIYTDMPEGSPSSFGTPQRPGIYGRPRRRRRQEGKPYHISKNIKDCGGYAVVKEGEDSPVAGGCHETLAEARAHMAALYASEKSMIDVVEQKHPEHLFHLSADERALHESLLHIATIYGKFNQDYKGIWAGYESPAENDVKDIGVKCANCTLYKGEGVCSIIEQQVEENGKCRFAIIPDGVVQKNNEMKSFVEQETMQQDDDTDWDAIEAKASGGPIRSHSTAVRDDTPINRSAILAVRSPETPEYFRKIFAYQLPNTDGTRKTHYTFIHHHISKDGRPSAAAMGELRVQMSVLNGARGGTVLRGADRKAVYNHLAKHYRDGGTPPPSLKSDEDLDNLMIKAGYITEPLTKVEVNE